MSDLACRNPGSYHLRGRILAPRHRSIPTSVRLGAWTFRSRRLVRDVFRFEVVNTRTGAVVYSDDAFGWEDAVNRCNRAVGIARHTWAMSIRSKELT